MRLMRPSIVVLAVVTVCAAGNSRAAYRLVEDFQLPGLENLDFAAADIDGDGQDEILVHFPEKTLVCNLTPDPDGTGLLRGRDVQFNFPEAGAVRALLKDISGDGAPDFIRSAILPDSTYELTFWDARRQLGSGDGFMYRLGPYLRGCRPAHEHRKGTVAVIDVLDADGNGRPEVYVLVNPFRPGCEQRCLLAVDGPSGALLWSFACAGTVTDVIALETRRGSGAARRLILGTFACDNGFNVDGRTDRESYVLCLDPLSGELQWATRTGGEGTSPRFALTDRDGDGQTDILVGVVGAAQDTNKVQTPQILDLDPLTGQAQTFPIPQHPLGLRQVDLDRDGSDEILLLGANQFVYCLDTAFRKRWVFKRCRASGFAAVELPRGSDRKLVVESGDSLFLVSARGKQLAEIPTTVPPNVPLFGHRDWALRQWAVAQVGGHAYLAVRQGASGDVVKLFRVMPGHPRIPWREFGAGGAALGLAGWLAYRRRRRRARMTVNRVDRDRAGLALLESMASFGHGAQGSEWATIKSLVFYLKGWERLEAAGGLEASRVPQLVRDLERRVQPALRDLAAVAREAGVADALILGLAERGDVTRDALRGLVEGSPDDASDLVQRARAALDDILERLRGIEAFLRVKYRCAPVDVCAEVLGRRRLDLDRLAIAAEIRMEGPQPVTAYVSPTILDKVIDNCVENSLRALSETVERRLEIVIRHQDSSCLIDVTDTGCGLSMPQSDWDRVFDPDYTTRARGPERGEGGFGLHFARCKLRGFGGDITVHASKPGAGTTFRIALEIVDEAWALGKGSRRA